MNFILFWLTLLVFSNISILIFLYPIMKFLKSISEECCDKEEDFYGSIRKDKYSDVDFTYRSLCDFYDEVRRYYFKLPFLSIFESNDEKYYIEILKNGDPLLKYFSIKVFLEEHFITCDVKRNLAYEWEEITPFLYDFFIEKEKEYKLRLQNNITLANNAFAKLMEQGLGDCAAKDTSGECIESD